MTFDDLDSLSGFIVMVEFLWSDAQAAEMSKSFTLTIKSGTEFESEKVVVIPDVRQSEKYLQLKVEDIQAFQS